MPIYNVNGIENIEDIKHLTGMSDQQIIQTLANLGQRMGVKGDSVEYGSFTFLDLIDNNYIPNDQGKKEIGILNYYIHPGKNCVFAEMGTTTTDEKYVHDKNVLWNNLNNEENVFNQQFFINNFKLETLVNNIEWYNANSIINRDGNILKTLLFGKILGMEVSEKNNLEIQYNEFNLTKNYLERGIRTYYAYSTSINEHYYILLDFKRVHKEEAKENEYKDYYTLDTYLINSKDVLNDINFDITSLYNYSTINTNEEFINISDNYVNIFNKKYFNEYNLFNLFFNSSYSSKYKNAIIQFDTEENKLMMEEYDDSLRYIESILVNTSEISIYDRITYINTDITYLYPQILAYYDEHAYKENKGILYRHIMYSLYEKLLSEYGIDDSYIDVFPTLYIPLSQKIFYLHNKANEFIIYFSNDIYVNNVDLSVYNSSKLQEILNSDVFIFDYSDIKNNDITKTYENRQSVYNIHFDYNSKFEHIINNINVLNIYTLPYINIRNNWVVNGLDTSVVAKAQVSNDQTLLIVSNTFENDGNISLKPISAINNVDIFNSSNTNKINEIEIEKDTTTLQYNLPELTESNYSYFQDILIILVSDSQCLRKNGEREQRGDKMCTFWQPTIDSEGNYKFDILKFDDNNILNGKDIFNLDDLKRWIASNTDMNNTKFDNIFFNISSTKAWSQDIVSESSSNEYQGKFGYIDPDIYAELPYNSFTAGTSANNDENYYNNMVYLFGTYNSGGSISYINPSKFITTPNNNLVTRLLAWGNKIAPGISSNTLLTYNDLFNIKQQTENAEVKKVNVALFKDVAQVIFSKDVSDTFGSTKLADIIEREYSIRQENQIIETINTTARNLSQNTSVGYYNDWDFNFNVPQFDFAEFIMKNCNVLNRLNILSLNSSGNIFNAYLGIDFTGNDEYNNELLLTSTHINPNVGKNTLMDSNTYTNLNTFDVFRMLFNEIKFDTKLLTYMTPVSKIEHTSSTPFRTETDIKNKEDESFTIISNPKTLDIKTLINPKFVYNIAARIQGFGYNGNSAIIPRIDFTHLFKYTTSTINGVELYENALTNMFYALGENNMLYNFKNEEFIHDNTKTSDKIFFNISYLLRQYEILKNTTKVKCIYYNNKLVNPHPMVWEKNDYENDQLSKTKELKEMSSYTKWSQWKGSEAIMTYNCMCKKFPYTDGEGNNTTKLIITDHNDPEGIALCNTVLYDPTIYNSNIFIILDESNVVDIPGTIQFERDENDNIVNSYYEGDSVYANGKGTIVVNSPLRITYWTEKLNENDDIEYLTLIINDGGLADTIQDFNMVPTSINTNDID